jgi:DNA-binding winged helix-turn-helix (wHTH) protein
MIYRFGPFALHTESRELSCDGRVWVVLATQPKLFKVLQYLIVHRDRIVTYDELLAQFWPAEANTTPGAMMKLIERIRELVHDHDPQQPVIKNYRGVGYRFVMPIDMHPTPDGPPASVLSPFIAGPPISHPVRFFGRVQELTRLFHLWRRLPLQNAAITGPRRSGKTSLLLHLQHLTTTLAEHLRPGQRADWLPEPAHYRWVFVDFQDPRFGRRENLLSYLLTCLDLPTPVPCDLDHFLEVMSEHLRHPTVILLDEIGVALQRYVELDEAFWESLRALATHLVGGRLAFVLTARESPAQLASSSQLSSPFFNTFGYTTGLGPLTEPEARALIASSPLPFSAAETDWILTHSQRWPLLLQVLCRARLIALEVGETDHAWQEDGLHQIELFRFLLDSP